MSVARLAVTEATELPESTSPLGRVDTGAMAFKGLSGSSFSDCRSLRIAPAHMPSTAVLIVPSYALPIARQRSLHQLCATKLTGRAAGRDSVYQYLLMWGVAYDLKKQ